MGEVRMTEEDSKIIETYPKKRVMLVENTPVS